MSKLLLPVGTQGAPKPPKSLTKEQIEERIKLLEKEKSQVERALMAYDGAIQDCQHWLKELSNDGQSNV